MNSFNHYAYGAVGAWMYEAVAGLDAGLPGYKHIIVRPRRVRGLSYAKAEYDSIYGKIVSDWRVENSTFTLNVVVPVNTTATVYVPCEDAGRVTESGVAAQQAQGVKLRGVEDGNAVFDIGSGQYKFACPVSI